MNILVFDPLQHYPQIYHILTENNNSVDYVCNYKQYTYYNEKQYLEKYNISYKTDIDKYDKYNMCFIIFPLLNIDIKYDEKRNKEFYNYITSLTNNIKKHTKIIIIDNQDYANMPENLNNIRYDIIFKRNYHKNMKYDKNIIPFHFVDCCCKVDPIHLLINNYNNKTINKISNKIWFSGRIYKIVNKKYNIYTNRYFIKDLKKKGVIEVVDKLPHNEYLNKIKEYKYALSLMGCSSWGTRHFEILAQYDTILFSQAFRTKPDPLNHIFPFENGDKFSEYNFFTSVDDLMKKYNEIESNDELYKSILNNQKYIIDKYYNNKYIYNYIIKHIP